MIIYRLSILILFGAIAAPFCTIRADEINVLNAGFEDPTRDEVSLTAFPSTPFVIKEFIYEPESDMVTLTWSSREGATYAVKVSTDLIDWEADLDDGIDADPGETTTRSFNLGGIGDDSGAAFFRIEQL